MKSNGSCVVCMIATLEALLRHALQMYVMSGAARGTRYFRHTGNDGLTGDVLTLVLTFADGVDLDDALWAALEAAFGAKHDAARAGAPARRSWRTAIAPHGRVCVRRLPCR